MAEQVTMVLAVFALLFGVLWVLKKRGLATLPAPLRRGSGSRRRLEVLERVPLTPQHAVHLVRVAGKTVLIGTAPSACTLLDAAIPENYLPENLTGSNS
jgi:flagellar biogenesis protein FliO